MSAVTAPAPAPSPDPARPATLPYGPPFLIGDPAASRRDLTLLRRALAAAGVVAEAAVARPVERAGAIAAQALEDGHRLLVAVGSDRLAHAVVRVLVDPGGPRWPEAVLGLAGLGRQDLSATFGLPDEPAKLARHLLGPNLFLADVGRARWRGPDGTERVGVFANTAELGYPAEVSARAPAGAAGGQWGTVGMVPGFIGGPPGRSPGGPGGPAGSPPPWAACWPAAPPRPGWRSTTPRSSCAWPGWWWPTASSRWGG
jgi:hypothetical protein